jgi:Uma2 family endonuclease
MLGEHFLVPDLAGWRKERFMPPSQENWISVCPDWVCEILSPSTTRIDKTHKMPIYAEYGLSHLWLIDPIAKILDVFRLETGRWLLLETFSDNDKVRAEPFQEVEIELGNLWWE